MEASSQELLDTLHDAACSHYVGKLVGHFPVGGWICIAAAFIKHGVTAVTSGLNDEAADAPFRNIIMEVNQGT